MYSLITLYLIFLKIGAFSFGGGYAMLPFIEEEVIQKSQFLEYSEFLDILAISQITPGPVAINSATFIGLKHMGILGSLFATLGIISAPIVFMNIVSVFIEKFKTSKLLETILLYIRPVTVALILSAFASTLKKTVLDFKTLIIFLLSFAILCTNKLHPIKVIFIFGITGIILNYFNI